MSGAWPMPLTLGAGVLAANSRLWPPCQVADRHTPYAHSVAATLREAGLEVVTDASSKTLPKRIRSHQVPWQPRGCHKRALV